MLCYSFLEKRGDYIKQLINWSLLNDGKIIIDNKNIECDYEANKFISYIDDNKTSNYIDLVKKIYIRENDEFRFKIDFENTLFNYLLKNNDLCVESQISCEFDSNEKFIYLTYNLDEEKKKIIIQII